MKIIGNISLEGDKSISHRALILASMCRGKSVIKNLVLSEVQLGKYFGEDDIVRYSDKYGSV